MLYLNVTSRTDKLENLKQLLYNAFNLMKTEIYLVETINICFHTISSHIKP